MHLNPIVTDILKKIQIKMVSSTDHFHKVARKFLELFTIEHQLPINKHASCSTSIKSNHLLGIDYTIIVQVIRANKNKLASQLKSPIFHF